MPLNILVLKRHLLWLNVMTTCCTCTFHIDH